jgi:hypothetical protein
MATSRLADPFLEHALRNAQRMLKHWPRIKELIAA